MLAVRLDAPGEELRLVDLPMPEPTGTEVRVRVAACGVCHTDLHIADGIQPRAELPLTLGHEVAGWIDAVGPETARPLRSARLKLGGPVLVYGGWGCGTCADCRGGAEQRCAFSRAPGFQADGGYAEAMIVPHPRYLLDLGNLDPVRAAPLADAGVTPFRAVRRAWPWLQPGARVLLIGCGGLGQFALQYLRLQHAGADIFVAVRELDARRLERAAELGADIGLLDGDPAMTLEALGGSPADVVLDFVGTDATLAHASAVVAQGGLVQLVGEAGGALRFGFDEPPVESWLTTVAWGSPDDLREVVTLARRGRVSWDVEPVPLGDARAAHARLRAGEAAARIVLVP